MLHVTSMTITQIKKSLNTLGGEDRLFLLHYLKHLLRSDTATHKRKLTQRHDEIAGGRKVTLEQVKRLDAAFKAEGF